MNDNLDPMVRVDPSSITLPWWLTGFEYLDLQACGPKEFDVRQIQRHRLPEQDTAKWICGRTIYNFHLKNNMVPGDFGIHEIRALFMRGLPFYQEFLKGVIGVGWKSLARDLAGRPDDLYVPFICERKDSGVLVMDWCKIDNAHFHVEGTAFRY